MTRYFFTITFENTSNAYKTTDGGLKFSGECVANDNTDAETQIRKLGLTAYENMFKEFAPTLYIANSNAKLYGVTNAPNMRIELFTETLVSEFGDMHNDKLCKAINEIWANNDYQGKLKTILWAYYQRDCEELANYFDEECVWWKANEVDFDEMIDLASFKSLCEVMFTYIFDDEDYKAIINYIRPQLSFVDNWWELL